MTKSESLVQETENFIRQVLLQRFKQKVKPEALRSAAEKLAEELSKVTETEEKRAA